MKGIYSSPSAARKYAALTRAGREKVLALVRDQGWKPARAINAVLCDELMARAS